MYLGLRSLLILGALVLGFASNTDAQTPTINSMNVTGPNSFSYSFSGFTTYSALIAQSTATKASNPEITSYSYINSSVGAGDPLGAFKIASAMVADCSSGSAYCWAVNSVTNIGGGGTIRGGIGYEIDLNDNWGNYAGSPGSPYAANLFLTGTNVGGYASCALCIEFGGNTSPMWNIGIHFGPGGYPEFNIGSIVDQSSSPESIIIQGVHDHWTRSYRLCVGHPILLGNDQPLQGFTTTLAAANLIYMGSDNNVHVGQAGIPVFIAGGVTCSGTPSGSFASLSGVVTHC